VVSAAGARIQRLGSFLQTALVRKIGFVAQHGEPDWVRIFKLAHIPPGCRAASWLRFSSRPPSSQIGFVA